MSDNFKSAQISHSVKPHHPQAVLGSIDSNFVENIESKRNGNKLYYQKMKLLQTDELDKSLKEYQNMKKVTEIEKENQRKDYRQRVNGVLGDIEKNIMARSMLFQSELSRQAQKQKRFVDENAIKERKISQLVQKHINPGVFNKQSDKYQQYQALEHSRTLKTMQIQKLQLQKKRDQQKTIKSLQMRARQQHQKILFEQRLRQQLEMMKSKLEYRMDLERMVEERREKEVRRPQVPMQFKRHNPITNPLQYHIENPYILRRLSKYN